MGNLSGEDPYVGGLSVQGVDKKKRALTRATIESDVEYASYIEGRAFAFTSLVAALGANEDLIYVRNDSTDRVLIIDYINLGADTNGVFTIYEDTASSTATGTLLTAKTLNSSKGKTSPTTYYGNAAVGGLTVGDVKWCESVAAHSSSLVNFSGSWVLGGGKAMAIQFDTAGRANVNIIAHFKDDV
jgi:hypothetical protein